MTPGKFQMGLALASCLTLVCTNLEAGYFTTITIDDDYADWSGVPVVDSDNVGDNFDGPDIGDTQIANDGQFLYIRTTFPIFSSSLAHSIYIAIDVDQNPATGFDILDLGILGSEASWQTDFGFSQATGVFNSGPLIGADFFGAGHALSTFLPFLGNRELAISLANANNGGVPTFPGDTIRLLIYTLTGTGADGIPNGGAGDSGVNGDVTAVIHYALATPVSVPVPEPTSLVLLAMAGISCWIVRRKRSPRNGRDAKACRH